MKQTMNQVMLTVFTVGIWVIAFWAEADDQTPLTCQQFVWEAGTAGIKEVYLSQVALDKSQNPDVKTFAHHMVRDHSSAGNTLREIANHEALDFPATNFFTVAATNSADLSSNGQTAPFNSSAGIGTNNMKGAEQLTMTTESATNDDPMSIRGLADLPEPQFDQLYARRMVQDHIAAIRLFEQATNDVPDKDLKRFAIKTLPILDRHYEMARALENKLSGVPSTNAPSMDQNKTVTSSMGALP